jgi:hypothetical protein
VITSDYLLIAIVVLLLIAIVYFYRLELRIRKTADNRQIKNEAAHDANIVAHKIINEKLEDMDGNIYDLEVAVGLKRRPAKI